MPVQGAEALKQKLRGLLKRGRAGAVAVVYEAPYAMHVHEDLEAYHRTGQAKFLEQPMRLNRRELAEACAERMRAGGTLFDGKVAAAERLLELSRALVPVRTGFLRDSGHVEAEGGAS